MVSASDNPLRVSIHPRVDDIDRREWDLLFRPPLEGYFWYKTLEESKIEDQFTFYYAKVFRGTELIAIAPCFVHDVPISLVAPEAVAGALKLLSKLFPRAGYQRTLFIGSPCSDEGTIGSVEPLELVLPALVPELRRIAAQKGARMIVFKDFCAKDVPALGRLNRFTPTVSFPGTIVKLEGGGKESYYRSLSHTHRHNLLKKLKRSAALLQTDTEVVSHPSPEVLGEIFGLFLQTYERGKTKFERLGIEFFGAIAAHPESEFIVLRERSSRRAVAFMLVFNLGSRVVNKFIGLDYSLDPKCSLYFRLFDAAVDYAYSRGAKELQSGQTGYRAKLDLGHELVPLHNVFSHSNPGVHWLFSVIGRKVTWQSLDSDLRTWMDAHPEGTTAHPGTK